MRTSRSLASTHPSSRSLLTLAGLALAAYSIARSRRDGRFFAGKVVLITGGSRGLGLAVARRLRAEGASLALLARDPDELARARQDLLSIDSPVEDDPGEVLTVPCDVTRPDEINEAVGAAVRHFGALDVVINSAGTIQVGPLAHMQPEDFEQTMWINFWGAFYTVWAARLHLHGPRGARIVNIASIGGKIAVPHLAPYSASKFALVGWSNALGIELAREGVRVTTVAPGLMRTGSHIQAQVKGQHAKEFDWFATSNGIPGFSVSVEHAAREIVEACRRGQPSLTFPLQMRAAEIAQAVFPNLTLRALALANRWLLPAPGRGADANVARTGGESRSLEITPAWKTALADQASGANNEG